MQSARLLLAKSHGSAQRPITLLDHSRQVRDAAAAVWDRIEGDLAAALMVDPGALRRELRCLLLIAGLLHDLGKANSSFQAMLNTPGAPLRQPVRHEIWSAILVSQQSLLRDWLAGALGEDALWDLTWAVGGHHLQMRRKNELLDREDPMFRRSEAVASVTLHASHPDVVGVLEEVQAALKAGERAPSTPLPELDDVTLDTLDTSEAAGIRPRVLRLARESERAWRRRKRDDEQKRRLGLLKALVIAADVAASALVAGDEDVRTWIDESLSTRLDHSDLDAVITARLEGRKPRTFQERIAESPTPATIAVAGCGNGKTLAAYMWAKRWAHGRKLFFTYPTTGTASVGYQDYLLEHDHIPNALIHGRAHVDLAAMTESPEDDPRDRGLRMESLLAWSPAIIACTVDTVLGLLQNNRRPLFSFPAIACGAFVFDEVHSYDRRLFGELLRFLRAFPGAPVLIMSASIPPARLERLRNVLGDRVGKVITGEPELEHRERYRLEARADKASCIEDVRRCLEGGGKVLWVCNTVENARRAGDEAGSFAGGVRILTYHSRFRYKDRVKRQDEVVRAFKSDGPCLAITTQVCEMSLDISADLLVTELCPLSSLIQRLGRLNRYAERDDPWPCLVYPFHGRPYHEPEPMEQMQMAEKFIAMLAGRPCSQDDLAAFLAQMDADSEAIEESSAWLDGGWQSESLPAREGDTLITILREDDLPSIHAALGPEPKGGYPSYRLVPWTIPMLAQGFSTERRNGVYPLAPKGSVDYDDDLGARWAK